MAVWNYVVCSINGPACAEPGPELAEPGLHIATSKITTAAAKQVSMPMRIQTGDEFSFLTLSRSMSILGWGKTAAVARSSLFLRVL